MKIHPTAVVSSSAHLADDVDIGPWAIVGDDVVLGAGCVVGPRATLEGPLVAGERNIFGCGVVIGGSPQDFSFDPTRKTGVRIGSGNTFREYVTIHRGTKEGSETVVGNECYLMVGAHLGHNVTLGNRVILANNCLLAGYVNVGDGAVVGGASVFHQFLRIGRLAMIGGGARFNKDIPPFTTAETRNFVVGVNLVGLRRAGLKPGVRDEIRRAFKLLYRSGMSFGQALEGAKLQDWGTEARELFDFVAASKRGVCRLRKGGGEPDEVNT